MANRLNLNLGNVRQMVSDPSTPREVNQNTNMALPGVIMGQRGYTPLSPRRPILMNTSNQDEPEEKNQNIAALLSPRTARAALVRQQNRPLITLRDTCVFFVENQEGKIIFAMKKEDFHPLSYRNLLLGKMLIVESAIEVFKRYPHPENKDTYDYVAHLEFLKKRLCILENEMKNGAHKSIDIADLYGRRAKRNMGPIVQDAELIKSQMTALEMGLERIKSDYLADTLLETPKFNEDQLMHALIAQGCALPQHKTPAFVLKEVLTEKLNQKGCSVMKKCINFPENGEKITFQISPAGTILYEEDVLNLIEKGTILSLEHFQGYKIEGQEILQTGIVNCHDIANYTHPKAFAHSVIIFSDGRVGFAGGRHGAIAAYGIDPEFLSQKGSEFTEKMIRDLLPEDIKTVNASVHRVFSAWCLKNKVPTGDYELLVGILAEKAQKDKTLCDILKRQASLNAAKEILIGELFRSPNYDKLVARARSQQPIFLCSISLLTPGKLVPGKENEEAMLEVQAQAWEDLQKEIEENIFPISLFDPKTQEMVEVKQIKLLQSSFGVNELAVKKKGAKLSLAKSELSSGWKVANVYNKHVISELSSAFEQKKSELIKALSETIPGGADYKALNQELYILTALYDQMIEIWKTKAYKEIGRDPYKMASRVALFVYMLDGLVCFNCKSGKDRTGALDVEVKYLAWKIYKTGQVPAYNLEKTEESVQEKLTFYFYSENFSWQQALTGFSGYMLKTGVVDQLFLKNEDKKKVSEVFFGACEYAPRYI